MYVVDFCCFLAGDEMINTKMIVVLLKVRSEMNLFVVNRSLLSPPEPQ